jgi:glycosyltransferase involved in cell wall biosynthesis
MNQPPMISIITPSYNCAAYIRSCIESVREQDYPNFEHIIVDGASKDGTVAILKEYPHLRWISEPDRGEQEGLNKALRMARGEVIGWLNADDYYLKGTFHRVVQEMDPQRGPHLVCGKTVLLDGNGAVISLRIPIMPVTLPALLRWFRHLGIFPSSMFFSKTLMEDVGSFREPPPYYGTDYDYLLRISAKGYAFHFVDQVLSHARLFRPNAKTPPLVTDEQAKCWFEISLPYVKQLPFLERLRFWKDYFLYYYILGRMALRFQRLDIPPPIRRKLIRLYRWIVGSNTRITDD